MLETAVIKMTIYIRSLIPRLAFLLGSEIPGFYT